ncbi:MAG TPA: ABC transporter permease subunit [Beijerinckiaceae bacterium]|jgi:general L-amino acid transport system permease protein|nr:ABC transporter permease subunit [Beijerinckiaceae bacterium]
MTDETISSDPFYLRREMTASRPPPAMSHGVVAFVRNRLFPNVLSGALTIVMLGFLAWVLPGLVRFLFIDAVWKAPDGALCRAPGRGACWAFVAQKLDFFIYASYPRDQVWRVDLTFAVGAALIVWLLWPGAPRKSWGAFLFFIAFPLLIFVLLRGAPALGLPFVDTDLWGGILVSLLVSLVGIVFSLPLGVLLALGRRSRLPVVRFFSVVFIEFVRGVPLITVLFMANFMLPLFVPDNWAPDRLVRPLIGVALFASAYMSEVVRGGLQAMPKGQFEGAMALGLNYWNMTRLVILPQALTIVIPGIVNTFIGLFKDTTLVAVVGIFDFLRTVDTARLDPVWAGPTITATGYLFAAAFYWIFCFGMSRYSQMMERRLSLGRR